MGPRLRGDDEKVRPPPRAWKHDSRASAQRLALMRRCAAGVAIAIGMNINFVIALMATSFLEQTIVTLVRVTTTYRAVEFGISVVGVGIIDAAFSILPIALAVAIGRYIDRGNDARAIWYGAALMIACCAGFLVADSQLVLILCTAGLGAAHMVMTVGLQVMCARQQGPGAMEKMIG